MEKEIIEIAIQLTFLDYMTAFGTVGAVIVALTLPFLINCISNKNKRKQITIEHLFSMENKYSDAEIKTFFGIKNKSIKIENVNEMIKLTEPSQQPQLWKIKYKLNMLLNTLERISTTVHNKIFDINIIKKLEGNNFYEIYKRYEPFIKKVRENENNDYYIEFEKLIKKLK